VWFLRISFVAVVLLSVLSLGRGDDAPSSPAGHAGPLHNHNHAHGHAHNDADHGASHNAERSPNGNNADPPSADSSRRWPLILLGLYCVLIVASSLFGGWLPHLVELSHNRMQIFISLIGGFMLGIGVFHMLPHALVELGEDGPDQAAYGIMAGLLLMFLLLRLFHFHHHGPTEVACPHDRGGEEHGHSHADGHNPQDAHVHASSPATAHHLSWVGVFLGMALHTLIDGLALGASVEADVLHGDASWFPGLGTFLAVVLHKPLDSIAITSLMKAGGWSNGARHLVSAAFALFCPLGAVLFVLGVREFAGQPAQIVGCALAVSAGVFLCIALSDLLPEMEFHSHNRVQLTAALLTGVALAWAIGFVESEHAHSHHHSHAEHSHKA